MVCFSSRATTLVSALLLLQVSAAPLSRRQTGSVQCNVARLQTVKGLSDTTDAVNKLVKDSANDPTAASAASDALTGLQNAQKGIKTIAQALISGQDAPADARGQVGDGLRSAETALDSIESNDPTVESDVQDALNNLAKTAQAGEQVVSLCGGGSGTGNNNSTNSSESSIENSGSGTAANSTDNSGSNASTVTVTVTETVTDSSAGATEAASNQDTSAQVTETVTATTTINGSQATQDAANESNSTASETQADAATRTSPSEKKNKKIQKRQIGDLSCNIARLKTVSNLSKAGKGVDSVISAAGSDEATANAAQDAQDAIANANAGISQIAQAIVTGQNAPAAARDQVGQGLTDAKTALSGITSTDPAVTSAVSKAQNSLDQAAAAGGDVVKLCK